MVSRLRVIFLGLGMLSTVIECAVAPPAVAPLPYGHPPYPTGTRRPDIYQPQQFPLIAMEPLSRMSLTWSVRGWIRHFALMPIE